MSRDSVASEQIDLKDLSALPTRENDTDIGSHISLSDGEVIASVSLPENPEAAVVLLLNSIEAHHGGTAVDVSNTKHPEKFVHNFRVTGRTKPKRRASGMMYHSRHSAYSHNIIAFGRSRRSTSSPYETPK